MKHLSYSKRLSDTGKTIIVDITSFYDNSLLGEVRWSGRWRQYVYIPSGCDIQWSWECLEELKNFIIELNKEQKYKKKELTNQSQQNKPETWDMPVKSQARNKRDITADTQSKQKGETLCTQ